MVRDGAQLCTRPGAHDRGRHERRAVERLDRVVGRGLRAQGVDDRRPVDLVRHERQCQVLVGEDRRETGRAPLPHLGFVEHDGHRVVGRDPDPRVRQSAATALGRLTLSGTTARDVNIRLREIARTDQSLIVRGAALGSDILLEKNAALPLAKQMMAEQVWQNVIRTPAVNALKVVGTPEALQLAEQYAAAAQ